MSERDELIDCLRYRPVATTAAQMREAADLLERDGAELARLADNALRFSLDEAGIASRERDAVELVELRAKLAMAKSASKKYVYSTNGVIDRAEARIAELERELTRTEYERHTTALERDELRAALAAARRENDWLRAYTSQSAKACVYCGLGADEQAQCERGFPGCARGDDQMLCPEVGVAIERDEARAALAEARESIAQWMMSQGFATGHGDTIDGLLDELTGQVREIKERAAEAQKDAIRYLWLRQSTLRTSGLPAICIICFDGYHTRIACGEADKHIDAAIAKERTP